MHQYQDIDGLANSELRFPKGWIYIPEKKLSEVCKVIRERFGYIFYQETDIKLHFKNIKIYYTENVTKVPKVYISKDFIVELSEQTNWTTSEYYTKILMSYFGQE